MLFIHLLLRTLSPYLFLCLLLFFPFWLPLFKLELLFSQDLFAQNRLISTPRACRSFEHSAVCFEDVINVIFFRFHTINFGPQALSPTNSSWRCWNVTWQVTASRCVGLRLGGSTRSAWNGGEDRASVWWFWLKVCCLWNMSISHRVVLIWSLKSKSLINIWSILGIKEEYFHPIFLHIVYIHICTQYAI